ncbi:MAG: hypothetical protein IJC71_07625 [Clostridia bacterium]|nr:hypothetical protein [Clostridia bacterium]
MKPKKTNMILLCTTAVLTLLLIILTIATIQVIQSRASARSKAPFDLESITAQQNTDADISDQLLPAFVGISADSLRYGLSNSADSCAELYRTVMPVLAQTLSDQYVSEGTQEFWNTLYDEENYVYIRYHHEFSSYVLQLLSGGPAQIPAADVYEMFLLPYSEQTNSISVVTRDTDGRIALFTVSAPDAIFTSDDLESLLRSYRSVLRAFDYAETGEPFFTESLSARNILITAQTSSLIHNNADNIDALIRLFGLNPDKLLNRHTNTDGTSSYIDQKGIFYIHDSAFSYTAVQNGGIPLDTHTGSKTSFTLADYVRISAELFENVRALNRHYAGGDADIILASVRAENGEVTLIYEYVFDNLRITGIDPAFTVTYADGKLLSAHIFTMSVRNLGTRTQMLTEVWFAQHISSRHPAPPLNVTLVYRSDFLSSSVQAEWCGEWLSNLSQ